MDDLGGNPLVLETPILQKQDIGITVWLYRRSSGGGCTAIGLVTWPEKNSCDLSDVFVGLSCANEVVRHKYKEAFENWVMASEAILDDFDSQIFSGGIFASAWQSPSW